MGKGLGALIRLLLFMGCAGKGGDVTVKGNWGPNQHEVHSNGQET